MRKPLLTALALLLALTSCSKLVMDPLRIQMPGTYWSYSVEGQTARVCFPDDKHVSILQEDFSTGYFQAQNGTYHTDGHRVICEGADWSSPIQFVRTFSHLKNSKTNRNLTPLGPFSHERLAGSVWASMVNGDLRLAAFMGESDVLEGTYRNAIHKEGHPYGWEWKQASYTLQGNKVQAGPVEATLFEDFLVVDSLGVFCMNPAPETVSAAASEGLAGTAWIYAANGLPAVILFTSESSFTRLMAMNQLIVASLSGTYSLRGTELRMEAGDIKETCQLQADRFTFSERTYLKASLTLGQ